MTTIAARGLPFKFLREWNVLRPFHRYFPTRKLSTQVETTEEDQNGFSDNPLINPLVHPDFFQVNDLFTVKDLFDAKVHLGHKEGSLDKRMSPFLYGTRMGHLIIDLDQTAEHLRAALNFTAHIAFRDGIILFVSRNPQTSHIVDKTAFECKEFSHTRHWKRGLFTNSTAQFKTVTRLPDLCIFIHTLDTVLEQHLGVEHAAKMSIPSIGIVDTNCNPNLITYPVPGNDDTPSAVKLYCRLFKEAIMRGKETRNKLVNLTVE